MDDFSFIIAFLVIAKVVSYLIFCVLVAVGVYLMTKIVRGVK